MLINAKYYDGISSNSHNVRLEIWSDRLYILRPEGNISWYYDKIIVQEKLSRHSDGRLINSDTPDAQINISNPQDFAKILEKLPRQKTRKDYRTAFYFSISIALLLFLIFFLIPAASPTIAAATPKSWEERIGVWATEAFNSHARTCNNPNGVKALNKLTSALAKHTNSELTFKPSVVESIELNAFAAPGGYIIFFSNMIESAASQAEVVGVLAHEMGHVTKRHSMEGMVRALMTGFLIDAFTGGAGSSLYLANQVSGLNYSRTKEAEADEFAIELLQKANVNPQGLYDFFSKLKKQESGLFNPEFLSSHPASSDRMAAISRKLNKSKEFSNILTEKEWQELKSICQ